MSHDRKASNGLIKSICLQNHSLLYFLDPLDSLAHFPMLSIVALQLLDRDDTWRRLNNPVHQSEIFTDKFLPGNFA